MIVWFSRITTVLEHLVLDSDCDSDEDDESVSELCNNYQSGNDYSCRLVHVKLILCIN